MTYMTAGRYGSISAQTLFYKSIDKKKNKQILVCNRMLTHCLQLYADTVSLKKVTIDLDLPYST